MTVNGAAQPKSHRLEPGAVVAVELPGRRARPRAGAGDGPAPVRGRAPAGRRQAGRAHGASRRGDSSGTLARQLLTLGAQRRRRCGAPGHRPSPRPRHVRAARRRSLASAPFAALQDAIREREVERRYLALVRGRPRSRTGRIDAPIGRDRRDPTRRSLDTDEPREAVTWFEVARRCRRARAPRRAARDGADAPDPRPPRGDRPPCLRRSHVRREGRPRARAPVPARAPAALRASGARGEELDARIAASGRSRRRARARASRSDAARQLQFRRFSSFDPATSRGGGAVARVRGSARPAGESPSTNRKGADRVSVVTMRELLEAGVHFGHQTRRWNPKMRRFIFGERGGIYIIDLTKTQELLEEAHEFSRNIAERSGTILFVGTKKQAQNAVAENATPRRHAVRQPPLARRPAHELADDLRADRLPPRPSPPEDRRASSSCCRRRSASRWRPSSRSSRRTSAASPT